MKSYWTVGGRGGLYWIISKVEEGTGEESRKDRKGDNKASWERRGKEAA